MGEMRILSREGDTKQIWDPENETEVEAAEMLFNELVKKKGYFAYYVDYKGKKTTKQMKVFDPTAGKIIIVPTVVAG